ncbi:Formin-F [Geodia barretti]|nr:Formin-F [Geodia barretti]
MYKKYTGEKAELPLADTFLLKLIEVPMLAMRLDLLFTIREFPVNMEEFKPTLDLAWKACHELDRSEEFLEVLGYVLAVGNYLNAGTPKGNAYGFQLKYLPKLIDFRGQEKTSLLDFLVVQIHRRRPDLLHMPSSLDSVVKASEISVTSILAEIEVMGNELKKIEHNGSQITQHPKMLKETGLRLKQEVETFLGEYCARLNVLDSRAQEMSNTYSKLLTKFGEKVGTDSEDFFATISQFLIQFNKVVQEKLSSVSRPSSAVLKYQSQDCNAQKKETSNKSKSLQKALTIDVIETDRVLGEGSATAQSRKVSEFFKHKCNSACNNVCSFRIP